MLMLKGVFSVVFLETGLDPLGGELDFEKVLYNFF
jgi:hypothetical protein